MILVMASYPHQTTTAPLKSKYRQNIYMNGMYSGAGTLWNNAEEVKGISGTHVWSSQWAVGF